MAGADDIIQNIVLAGQQDVIAGLDSIGAAGTKAFESIANAATNIGDIGAAFAGVVGAASSVAILTAGIFALTDAAANNVVKMANFADEMGTTTGNMGGLITALNEAGNQTSDLTVSFRRIAVASEAAWPKMQKQVREAANTMKEDFVKVAQATVELEFASKKAAALQIKDTLDIQQAQNSLAKSQLDASRIQQTNQIASIQAAQSVIGAINNVAAAEFNLRQLQGGVSDAEKQQFALQQAANQVQQAQTELQLALIRKQREEEDQQIRTQQALLDVRQKTLALQEAQRKKAEDQALAPARQAEAELKLAQAQEKQKEDQVNSVGALQKFIEDLAKGADVSGQKVQISTQNVIKGLLASVGSAANALQGFSGSIGDVTTKTPALFDVMLKVADVFQHTQDATLRAALATALFGRGYSFTLVAALEEGSEALKKNMERLKALGFEYTSFDEHVGREFLKALGSVEAELKILGTQMGLTFAPAFTVILRQIQAAVENNREAIVKWAESVRDAALPVIAGFLRALTGIDVTKALELNPEQIIQAAQWANSFNKVIQFVKNFAIGAKDFILNTFIPAFGVLKAALDDVATGINNIFNTKLTGGDLGIGILILAFSGLGQAIISVTTSFALLAVAFALNPFGLAALAISAAIVGLGALAIAIYRNRQAINDFIDTKIEGAWNWLVDSFEDAATSIKRGLEDIKQTAIDTLTFASSATIVANDKVTAALRKSQDEATAAARAARDEALKATQQSNAGTPADNANTTVAPQTNLIDEAKQKWAELGQTIEAESTKLDTNIQRIYVGTSKAAQTAADINVKAYEAEAARIKALQEQNASNARKFAADDLAARQRNLSQQDGLHETGVSSGTGASPNPFLTGNAGAQQTGGPQHEIVPKTQILGDLQQVNSALANTGEAIIRTFGGDNVLQTKVKMESAFKDISQAADGVSTATQKAGDKTEQATSDLAKSATPLENLKQPLDQAGQSITDFSTKVEEIKFVGGELANPFQDAATDIASAFQALPSIFDTIFAQIEQAAQNAANRIQQSISAAAQAGGNSGSGSGSDSSFQSPSNPPTGPGFADGGLFRGKGGIDTNLAWLTDLEFIMNPSAVKHWGVDFMHRINRRQNPFEGFNVGGLFRSFGSRLSAPMIPAFATGGLNRSPGLSGSQQRALTLVLGGQTFPGLSGPADVVDALEQHAVHDQLRATGYSPRWKK